MQAKLSSLADWRCDGSRCWSRQLPSCLMKSGEPPGRAMGSFLMFVDDDPVAGYRPRPRLQRRSPGTAPTGLCC